MSWGKRAKYMVGLWLSVQTNAPPGATIAMFSGVVFVLSLMLRRLTGSGVLGSN
jgi:ABC-type Mn2+/Zn2+ transport system permease subunit